MGRPASYDRSEVIERAADVFRRRGYRATSVADLTEATGLKPGSLYAAFGSKRGLFLEVLADYQRDAAERLQSLIESSESPMAAIRRFLADLAEESAGPARSRGCLAVNTMLDYSQEDVAVRRELEDGLARIEALFRLTLERARHAGELDPELDTDAAAAFLLNNVWGLRVMCRGQPSRRVLDGIVQTVLAALESLPPQRGSMRRM